jgi:hypothetical protein
MWPISKSLAPGFGRLSKIAAGSMAALRYMRSTLGGAEDEKYGLRSRYSSSVK